MSERSPYHLSPQGARGLLGPTRAELEALETRLRHYQQRIPLRSDEVATALATASEALALARAAIAEAIETHEASRGSPNPAARKRVLITGAAGRIGSDLANRLHEQYALRLMGHRRQPENAPTDDVIVANAARFGEVAAAMESVDAVIHLAADPSTRAPWESVLANNIVATYNVFEAARQAGAQRVVFASTNHVMGMYDRDRQWPIYADQPVRPDSLYGVSKAFGENLGRFYHDQYGLSVICLRIGWWQPEPTDDISRWMWLSPRDCAQVVTRALETDLGYGVFYAISANSRRHWDITATMEQLGYRPEDDAERFFEGDGVMGS